MEGLLNIPDNGVFSKAVVFAPDGGSETLPREIVMGRHSKLNLVLIVLPGVSLDLSLSVRIEGEGAQMDIAGAYLCPVDEKVNIKVSVLHAVPNCASRQLFKGIVAGRAATSFHGLIRVAQDAQKTEAYQENHNLLLSSTAVADTKPQLEIYADDVKCSHGATVGRLSEEEQFYMRSRGLSEAEAVMLQMVSFLSPVLARIEDPASRSEAAAIVQSALRSF